MIALLDANVLVALFDPTHVHHEAAHAWFGANRGYGWATCPVTENALVRIISNPTYPGRRTMLQDAVSRLRTFCSSADHSFWADTPSVRSEERFRLTHLQGYRQLTDVYLLALAVEKKGRLATFDGRIPLRSVAGAAKTQLAVIPP